MKKDDELPESLSGLTAPTEGDYGWLVGLTRAGWAWEFLRRNPEYRQQYSDRSGANTAEEWGLRYFEDPMLDARDATAYWLPEWCPAVLPVSARPLRPDERAGLDSKTLACQTRLRPRAGGADVLFVSEGRLLQVELSGSESLENVALSVPVVPMPEQSSARVLAIRRFVNLVTSESLQPMLYAPERRAPRLSKVLLALDCWIGNQTYRDIAVHLFGKQRVANEWNNAGDHMRDQVRRAVYYGRNLLEGGYKQFLK
jgi:hypothetical protein